MKSLDFKFDNLKKAYLKLKEAAEKYNNNDEIIRDSLIQRFEFTYELCHKTLQELLKYEGIVLENSFPREIFKKAFANNLISNDKIWINLLEDRNSTSHIYNEDLANSIAQRIVGLYIKEIGVLIDNLERII